MKYNLLLKYPPSYHFQKDLDAIERDKDLLIRYIVEDDLITQVTELTRDDRPVCLYKPNIEIKRFFEKLRTEQLHDRVRRILEERNMNKRIDLTLNLKKILDHRYIAFLEESWNMKLSDFDLNSYLKTKALNVFSQIKM